MVIRLRTSLPPPLSFLPSEEVYPQLTEVTPHFPAVWNPQHGHMLPCSYREKGRWQTVAMALRTVIVMCPVDLSTFTYPVDRREQVLHMLKDRGHRGRRGPPE